jgi:hypothetical protein
MPRLSEEDLKQMFNSEVDRCKRAEAELAQCRAERRRAAQILIEEIGAPGPEDLLQTVERVVEELRKGRREGKDES